MLSVAFFKDEVVSSIFLTYPFTNFHINISPFSKTNCCPCSFDWVAVSANADEIGVSANVAMRSNYMWRGMDYEATGVESEGKATFYYWN
ncbi:MAG: hypothetical protein IE887_01265 [Campylobacterales bacterium]|nr:hypothetical protein [Campylobacterales bacterium]